MTNERLQGDSSDASAGSFAGRRIGFAAPMLGGHEGYVVSQQEILAVQMVREGAIVLGTSSEPGRLRRLFDTLLTVWKWRGQVDLVVISIFSGLGFWIGNATSLMAKARGIPQIQVLRGGNLPDYQRRNKRMVKTCLARADAVVAPSQYLASSMEFDGEISIIPNVFDLDAFGFRERSRPKPTLLWMRTFHEIYNPLLALDVLVEVRKSHPGATLTMAGQEKGMLASCQARVKELGLDEAVRFAGFLDAEAKLREFENHDIYLHTNDVDNTPVSVLEAAAAGLVVVGTNVGGMPFLLESEESALLVEPQNPERMARAVLRVLDEPELGTRLSASGRLIAEESAWPSIRQKWISQIDAVVSLSDERARIEQVYGGYHTSGRDQQRWDNEAAGNRCIIAERHEAISRVLSARGAPKRVLEIGCGGGTVIGQLRDALDDETEIFGVDLLADRLAHALQAAPVAQADGRTLPFRSDAFDLVVVFTVFSSILDQTIRMGLAREIARVLAPSGTILWYDMRYLSPNRSVQPLGRTAIQQLFPGSTVQTSSLTVLPPLARWLGESDRRLYPALSRMPFLRSHLLATVVPSSSRDEGTS